MRKHKINDKEKRRQEVKQEARQRQGRGKAEVYQEVSQSNKKVPCKAN